MSLDPILNRKLARLAAGHPPRVLDLFAGCGGISLGFQRAGFEIAAAVELDPEASASHSLNFHEGDEVHAAARDITATEPALLVDELDLAADPSDAIDVIVGGPPCQSFARVGRAKLREVREHPEAFVHDPRARLYLHYLEYVAALEPLALLVENVPDVINHSGHNVPQEMCDELVEMGYDCRYTILNAAYYGVPQMRDRMFLLAYRRELGLVPAFPAATNHVELPRGYHGTRSVALKHVRSGRLNSEDRFYVEPQRPASDLPPAVTAAEAVCDLPRITKHLEGRLSRGPARFDERLEYRGACGNAFTREMRDWPGFETPGHIVDHIIRYLPRDYPIFARMKPGDQYPQAHSVALSMFDEALARRRGAGSPVVEGSAAWEALRKSIVPPYDPGKFPNKWRKMEADNPARTLMAHIGKDSYSHIHFDSSQARTISVREAARFQSFPDGFRLVGRMNASFRQIGNAVPALLAAALATEMMTALEAAIAPAPDVAAVAA